MNILLDFIPFQYKGGVGGAPSYTKAVCDEVCLRCSDSDSLFAAYDSSLPVGRQYNYQEYAQQHHIQLLDIATDTLSQHIARHHIDTLFIALGQFYASYPLTDINCKVVMGIHDIWDVEREDNLVELTIRDMIAESKWQWVKRMISTICGRRNRQQQELYRHIVPLYAAPNTVAFTVSAYTQQSLCYYFPQLSEKQIYVYYSPSRQTTLLPQIEDKKLQQVIADGKPYLLMLTADRRLKNVHTLTKVFKRLHANYPDLRLVTLNYGHSTHQQHIDIPFLSDSDLEHAYKNAHALVFGSFFEGFGYPPIEAMRYNTPCVASNVTSIPEILGNAGIYFSPFYPADLYRAIKEVLNDRDCRHEQMQHRYVEVSERQREDLKLLVNEIFQKGK